VDEQRDHVTGDPDGVGGDVMTQHGLVVNGVDPVETGGFRVAFGCLCGDYSAEETAATEPDALTRAANQVRVHEATVTGSPTVDIRF
jgi:hypothetical protein